MKGKLLKKKYNLRRKMKNKLQKKSLINLQEEKGKADVQETNEKTLFLQNHGDGNLKEVL